MNSILPTDRIEQTYSRAGGWSEQLVPPTVSYFRHYQARNYRDVERVRIAGKGDFLVTEIMKEKP